MSNLRVGVFTHSDLFAAGVRQLFSHISEFELIRLDGKLRSIRRHFPLHVLVLDSESVGRVKLRSLLVLPELPTLRVLVVDLGHNHVVVFDRSKSVFRREEDIISLISPFRPLERKGGASALGTSV